MKKLKKGFTLVELVIVIAVIAVLAAVLIPTFSGIIQNSRISADQQNVQQLNTILGTAEGKNVEIQDMSDVIAFLNSDEDVTISTLRATARGYNFAWHKTNNQIFIVDSGFKVSYPENYKEIQLDTKDCWIMANNPGAAQDIAKNGYNIYFDGNVAGTMTLSNWVSVDTGVYAMTGTTIINGIATGDDAETNKITLRGNFKNVEVNNKAGDAEQFGSIDSLTVTAIKDGTFSVNGTINKVADIVDGKLENKGVITEVTKVTKTNGKIENKGSITTVKSLEGVMDNKGQVAKIETVASTSTLTNNGVVTKIDAVEGAITNNKLIDTVASITGTAVVNNNGAVKTITAAAATTTINNDATNGYIGTATGITITGAQAGANQGVLNTVETSVQTIVQNATTILVNNATELAGIATAVNNKTNSYEGLTIKLAADIDLSNRAWTPIGATKDAAFKGSFDGAGYTITGLSNAGYVGKGNLSTIQNASNKQTGTVFALFGFVDTEKDKSTIFTSVKFADVAIDIKEGLGVGALIGTLNGQGNITISNIDVLSGTITAKDKAAGVIGIAGYYANAGVTVVESGADKNINLNLTLASCSNAADVTVINTAKYNRAGGILGASRSGSTLDISTCVNSGDITANKLGTLPTQLKDGNGTWGHVAGLIGCTNGATLVLGSGNSNSGELDALDTAELTYGFGGHVGNNH